MDELQALIEQRNMLKQMLRQQEEVSPFFVAVM